MKSLALWSTTLLAACVSAVDAESQSTLTGVLTVVDGETSAGWGAVARSLHGRTEIMFGLVIITEAHLAFFGARTHANNTAEMTAMIEAFSFLGPRGPVALDANSCICYDSKHAAGVYFGRSIMTCRHVGLVITLIPLLALVLAATLETFWKHCVTSHALHHSVYFYHFEFWWKFRTQHVESHNCASFVCSVTRSTTTEFQHNDIMMKTTVQNDSRLKMASSVLMRSQTTKRQLKTSMHMY